jgi:hypothetical protein
MSTVEEQSSGALTLPVIPLIQEDIYVNHGTFGCNYYTLSFHIMIVISIDKRAFNHFRRPGKAILGIYSTKIILDRHKAAWNATEDIFDEGLEGTERRLTQAWILHCKSAADDCELINLKLARMHSEDA